MKKQVVSFDILFYIVVPMLIWNCGKEIIGDYFAMLLSTVPGFIYTIYIFFKVRQFNLTGLYAICSLFISTSVDLLSGSAEKMLWNQVYTGLVFAMIFLLSVFIKKPLALYFSVDFAALSGQPRKNSLALFSVKANFVLFQWLTLVFFVRGLFLSSLKAWLLHAYGVNSYSSMLIYTQISSRIFVGFITLGYIIINKKINNFIKTNDFDFPVKVGQ